MFQRLPGTAFKNSIAARGAAFGDLNNDGQIDAVIGVLDDCSVNTAQHGNAKSLAGNIACRIQIKSKRNRRALIVTGIAGQKQIF